MNWEILIPIIARYGIEVAERIWINTQSGLPPTQDEWNRLKEMAKLRAVDLMRQSLARAGIDPESDQGKALLAAATTTVI